jgi:hypothetical protein
MLRIIIKHNIYGRFTYYAYEDHEVYDIEEYIWILKRMTINYKTYVIALIHNKRILLRNTTFKDNKIKSGDTISFVLTKKSVDHKYDSRNNLIFEIKWIDKNRGEYIYHNGTKKIFYINEYLVTLEIQRMCLCLINELRNKWYKMDDKSMYICDNNTFIIRYEQYPAITSDGRMHLVLNICDKAPKLLLKYISEYKLDDVKISNFVFLALLGRKREFDDECYICLNDNTFQATIFRPCGHYVCSECFSKYKISYCGICESLIYSSFCAKAVEIDVLFRECINELSTKMCEGLDKYTMW